jgi:hypothetical protein
MTAETVASSVMPQWPRCQHLFAPAHRIGRFKRVKRPVGFSRTDGHFQPARTVEVYDPAANTWEVAHDALPLAERAGTMWTERLEGSCWASPIGVADRVYFFGRDGVTTVVKSGPAFEQLAQNRLTIEGRVYGVAVVPGAFIIRTGGKLIRVGQP